ncbi:hypothetical protein Goklo_008420 [Gossypium klotzschianum]|uniref:DUF4283 domain-containing protein n=1 Tax=Gossypium klotzschianum TaxID=34286 RepID=A0A7J8V044_9ROSI|nr:hypothetical protein [Gossypium klotzschianum]
MWKVEVTKSVVQGVIDPVKLNWLSHCAVGWIEEDFSILNSLWEELLSEGISGVDVFKLSGRTVIFSFNDIDTFQSLKKWFLKIEQWSEERDLWGKLVRFDYKTENGDSLIRGRIQIITDQEHRIDDIIELNVGGKSFEMRVVEIDSYTWSVDKCCCSNGSQEESSSESIGKMLSESATKVQTDHKLVTEVVESHLGRRRVRRKMDKGDEASGVLAVVNDEEARLNNPDVVLGDTNTLEETTCDQRLKASLWLARNESAFKGKALPVDEIVLLCKLSSMHWTKVLPSIDVQRNNGEGRFYLCWCMS